MVQNLNINRITGHLEDCEFAEHPNRVVEGRKAYCFHELKDGQFCGGQISKQSCLMLGKGFCAGAADHWGKLCKKYGWNRELSRCANIIADSLKIPKELRSSINQNNIQLILGIPNNKEYNHISDRVRREVEESEDLERMEEEDSEEEENEEEEDDWIEQDIESGEDEENYESEESESEESDDDE